MKTFTILAAAAVLLNALPLAADAHQAPGKPETRPANSTPQCARFTRGLFDICLREAGGDTGQKRACLASYRENRKQCAPAR